jgi:hypothetical protein
MRTSGKLTNLIRYSLAFVFLFPGRAHKAVKIIECTTARDQATSAMVGACFGRAARAPCEQLVH